MKPLDEVLAYRNDAVITKFTDYYNVDRSDAEDLFLETKRWMWLCANRPTDLEMVIQDPLLMLDNMWHTFILFTKDYHEFCDRFFGRYIHHLPVTSTEKRVMQSKLAGSPNAEEEQLASLERFYRYIYDSLGQEVFLKWYVTFSNRYTPDYIASVMHKVDPESGQYFAPTVDTSVENLGRDAVIAEILATRFKNRYCRGCGVYCTCRRKCTD